MQYFSCFRVDCLPFSLLPFHFSLSLSEILLFCFHSIRLFLMYSLFLPVFWWIDLTQKVAIFESLKYSNIFDDFLSFIFFPFICMYFFFHFLHDCLCSICSFCEVFKVMTSIPHDHDCIKLWICNYYRHKKQENNMMIMKGDSWLDEWVAGISLPPSFIFFSLLFFPLFITI